MTLFYLLLMSSTLFILSIFPMQAAHADSQLFVGERSIKIADSVAVFDPDFFGSSWLGIYLFATKLTPRQKLIASLSHMGTDQSLGVVPIASLQLTFPLSASRCAQAKSYTIVFKHSESFPIDVRPNTPVNFGHSTTDGVVGKYGLELADCQLRDGSVLRVRVRDSSLVSKSSNSLSGQINLLATGVDSLDFSWDLDLKSEIVGKEAAFRELQASRPSLRIDNSSFVDSDAIRIPHANRVVIRFYDKKIDPALKGKLKSPDPDSEVGRVRLAFTDKSLTECSVSIREHFLGLTFKNRSAKCLNGDLASGEVISGETQTIVLKLRGATKPELESLTPAMSWNISGTFGLTNIE